MSQPSSDRPVSTPTPRELRDPKAMRALAHPVRMALLEELGLAGELTATGASERLGESPASCSFHLRQLAKYGFVEETGDGRGRNRPWRLTNPSLRWDSASAEGEPETARAMSELTEVFQSRALARLTRWFRLRPTAPRAWRRAAQSSQTIWWVTPEELEALGEEITALLWRYFERYEHPELRPPGAAPVEFLAFTYPLRLEGAAAAGDPEEPAD